MNMFKVAISLLAALMMSLMLSGTAYAQDEDATSTEDTEMAEDTDMTEDSGMSDEAEPVNELDTMIAEADIERGKDVYERVGVCLQCHGWDGNGLGKNPRSPGRAALLRETELDNAGLVEIIECGIPGTPMPYHNRTAYSEGLCFGMTLEDFGDDAPGKGDTFRHEDTINLVAYMREFIIGQGETTLEDCAAFYGRADHPSCRGLD